MTGIGPFLWDATLMLGALLVIIGEMPQIATSGYLRAAKRPVANRPPDLLVVLADCPRQSDRRRIR